MSFLSLHLPVLHLIKLQPDHSKNVLTSPAAEVLFLIQEQHALGQSSAYLKQIVASPILISLSLQKDIK